MQEVKSSIISHISFIPPWSSVPAGGILVRFKTGKEYLYLDVSKEEYESIIKSDSVGSKFKEVVKGKSFSKA